MRRSVRFFDFETVSNNEFLVTEEFVVKGPQRERRFDLVIHVNGLPLVVIECKDPADPHAIEKGVGDLLAYQRAETGAPRLFETIHFCLALNRRRRAGTVATELTVISPGGKACAPSPRRVSRRRWAAPRHRRMKPSPRSVNRRNCSTFSGGSSPSSGAAGDS
ncbi:MAG: type I restriction endonuclease [Verrucomicrobiales bacterium]